MSTMTNNERALVRNALLTRAALLNTLVDQKRDIDVECGYPKEISAENYQALYDREGIAARVVAVFPEESWGQDPEVLETEKATETEFEKAWKELEEKHNLMHYLQRADELSGIGRFGVLLLGIDDGLPLDQPVASINEQGERVSEAQHNLLFVRAFPETVVTVDAYQMDPANPRFGQPTFYSIRFTDVEGAQAESASISKKVHWSRIIHLADNRRASEVMGTPRMKPVFNRLYDLRKVLSGSGEMFWKGAFPGFTFEVNPDVQDDVELDKDAMREEFERYSNGLQRYMALTGVSAKSLAPQVSDPGPHMMAHLKAICISLGIPWRIFLGSEEAKLASVQDSKAWNARLAKRRERYLSPMVIKPFVQRLMDMGILPSVEQFYVVWPDLEARTEADKADVAVKKTEALAKYVGGNVDNLVPPKEFFTVILDMTEAEADAIIEAAEKYLQDVDGMHNHLHPEGERVSDDMPDGEAVDDPNNSQPQGRADGSGDNML